MKKIFKRVASLAMAAATAFSFAAFSGTEAAKEIFDTQPIVAEAAADQPWCPDRSDFILRRYNSYSAMPSSSAKSALYNALSSKVTTGYYKNYKVVNTEARTGATYSDNVIMLYDPAKRPLLNGSLGRFYTWMEYYMQFVNTNRHITGTSHPYLFVILDSLDDNGSPIGYSYSSYNKVNLNSADSNQAQHAIMAFSDPYMNGALLHETSHSYTNRTSSNHIFDSFDDTYCNLLTMCSARTLKKNGADVLDIILESASGNLMIGNTRFASYTPLQYMSIHIRNDYNTYFLPNNLNQILNAHNGNGHGLVFFRQGLLFNKATGVELWDSMLLQRQYADAVDTGVSVGWNKLLALLIVNPNNVSASFMSNPKSRYLTYKNSRTVRADIHDQDLGYFTNEIYVTPAVRTILNQNFNCQYGYYEVRRRVVRALSAYDFLTGGQVNSMLNTKVAGHSTITYKNLFCSIIDKCGSN